MIRRCNHRLAAIDRRIEVLDGYLLVYLNLDEVIRIIREEDEPKPRLVARFTLTETQAEAILNMRLRSLRRLEEIEIRREHDKLTKERKGLRVLLDSDKARWKRISVELEDVRKKFGSGALGDRRAKLGETPAAGDSTFEGFVEREP